MLREVECQSCGAAAILFGAVRVAVEKGLYALSAQR
jgi:hypothetical protein